VAGNSAGVMGRMALTSETMAVVFERPGEMNIRRVGLLTPASGDCVVDIEWSGISTGTERLLWSGRMPAFPGLGYPLVPGYESVGRISTAAAGCSLDLEPGQRVFVPGSRGFCDVRGLFGGTAERLVVAADRLLPLAESVGDEGVLLALAATALHALGACGETPPELIIGHGVLGRLLVRTTIALGHPAPVVWEADPGRSAGASGYTVCAPGDDPRRDYRCICDVSGDAGLLDSLIERLRPGGRIVLGGFYDQPLSFRFANAFLREVELKVAAEWQPADLQRVAQLIGEGALSLSGLISHHCDARQSTTAYHTAFTEPECLKMVLDWRPAQ
jgi:3-hydroxyethyl bacteriochlorophyllide a dehydrogenase